MTQSELNTLIATNVPDNTTQFITPARLREVLLALVTTEFDRIKAPISLTIATGGTFTLAAGETLEAIVADQNATSTLKIGFSSGASELLDTDLGGVITFIRMDYYAAASTTLHVTGDADLTIFKKKP
jgi:hypothetical protein